ncbi:hypothetical protein [Bartonella sp. B41]
MKNISFITEDEMIIILCDDDTGGAYKGPIDQVEDALDFIYEHDSVQKILRLDLITLHADDVSEQIADAYITNNEIDEQDIQIQPFILNSDAYHAFLDAKVVQDYEDNLYGSYERQHRLRPCDVLTGYWW